MYKWKEATNIKREKQSIDLKQTLEANQHASPYVQTTYEVREPEKYTIKFSEVEWSKKVKNDNKYSIHLKLRVQVDFHT